MPQDNHQNDTPPPPKKKHPLQHLLAGGTAGLVESSVCHPLDTIKTRMQLRRQVAAPVAAVVRHSLVEPALRLGHSLAEPRVLTAAGTTTTTTTLPPPPPRAPLGPLGTAARIVQREGFLSLYKGLTAVYTGIIPKMAIRFVAFEQYREWGAAWTNGGTVTTSITFLAGLASGLTEAVLIVTPAEVCKIRMQSQYHSLMDATARAQKQKYTNVVQTAATIVREEGIAALYKGVVPTMLRQGCNQAVNFTAYNAIKHAVLTHDTSQRLSPWQSLLIGGVSGGMGPLVNNPLDVVKTRLQKQVVVPGRTAKYTGLGQACRVIAQEEGVLALWKGITPRLMRIMPGQAITFMTYEAVSEQLNARGWF